MDLADEVLQSLLQLFGYGPPSFMLLSVYPLTHSPTAAHRRMMGHGTVAAWRWLSWGGVVCSSPKDSHRVSGEGGGVVIHFDPSHSGPGGAEGSGV